jgi:hypothetical protein
MPGFRYNSSSIRKVWGAIRRALDSHKVPTGTSGLGFGSKIAQKTIEIDPAGTPLMDKLPVLIETSYHPNWHRKDGDAVYAATPFFMLTFVGEPMRLVYERGWWDWVGLSASAVTLIILCGFTGWRLARPEAHERWSHRAACGVHS